MYRLNVKDAPNGIVATVYRKELYQKEIKKEPVIITSSLTSWGTIKEKILRLIKSRKDRK
jgi:hypothetical protein